jgi:hypothetical protein
VRTRPWLALALLGCGHSCPAVEGPAFHITVTSKADSTEICGANIIASTSSGTFTLIESPSANGTACSYGDANGVLPVGAYTLTVSAPGFLTAVVAGPQVTRDDCNLEKTTVLTVRLAPG